MPIHHGMTEDRVKVADLSLPRSNVVAFPYRQMLERTVGLNELMEAREVLLQASKDMAFLNAVLSELRDIALSTNEILEKAGRVTQVEIADDPPPS